MAHVGGVLDECQRASRDGSVESVRELNGESHVLVCMENQDRFAAVAKDLFGVADDPGVHAAVEVPLVAPVTLIQAFEQREIAGS
jgi:hypothetical protein